MDYTNFKLRNVNEETDNYMKGSKFFFNAYKTKNKYGKQSVDIPSKLRYLIHRWTRRHPHDHLLFNEKGMPLAQPRLTAKLNQIFGKNISVNMLRHIFISEKVLEDVPALQKLSNIANDMGHSVDQQMLYKKVS